MNFGVVLICGIFAFDLITNKMKIYFDTNLYDECLNPCPNGKDCMVGSLYCMQCPHHLYMKRLEDPAMFFVGNNRNIRQADYVECCCDEPVTLVKLIKKYINKIF